MAKASFNPWEMALQQLDAVAGKMKLDPDLHAILRKPKRALIVSIPTRMDDGSVKVYYGGSDRYQCVADTTIDLLLEAALTR